MQDINDFQEDWEDIEEIPAYTFLKDLQILINSKSKTGKNTRKFLRMAYDLVRQGEISEEELDNYIETSGVDKGIAREAKIKYNKPKIKPRKSSSHDDGCGGGGGYRSSC